MAALDRRLDGSQGKAASPAVSVIIPARDAASTLGRTIDALRAQELAEPFEVIVVVDDDSVDDTVAIARRNDPFVNVISRASGEGPGAARTRGARAARAPVLAFTDADCFPTPRWLALGLETLERADVVQGAVQPDPDATRTPFDRSLVVEGDGGFYQTANLLVRREVFEAVGGFRDWALERPDRRRWSADRRRAVPTRTPIGDDTLFGWTARRLGARSAFAPDAVVHHQVVPGTVRDEMADRWHWTRDMPGLARLVPELRNGAFHRHWFFNARTARFDLAVAGLAAAAVTRRRLWLAGVVPYATWVTGEARRWGVRRGVEFALGAPASDAATVTGLVVGSIAWRSLVL
jgi:glycosyltransferase involved in cell wall biosynthesis